MDSLTLDKALELYEILGAYIPEVKDKDIDALEFIGKIVRNIRNSGKHQNYVDAVMLMSNKEWEELKTFEFNEVLSLFIEGLSINKIVSLEVFCKKVGFDYVT